MRDRLSFTRFLGLASRTRLLTPTTLWLFREKLAKAGLIERLFDRFDKHLLSKANGRDGQWLITFVPVPKRRDGRAMRRHGGNGR